MSGKKRGKYGRPCDLCSSRRVRCNFVEGSERCQGCINHNIQCTQNRIRKKSGPKSKRLLGDFAGPMPFSPLPDILVDINTSKPIMDDSYCQLMDPYMTKIPLDKLIAYLQVYQTWFYGYWPVLSVAEIILKITTSNLMSESIDSIRLTEKNAFYYSLACSVCAAIATQMTFVSVKDRLINEELTCLDTEYANEAKRARNLFDYTENPCVEVLLSSFFLYAHYTNKEGRTNQAIIYLREAISVSQLLGFHDSASYNSKSAAEKHRWQKIFYTLLVTERYVCFEDAMPVILEPSIAFPLLHNEEYPSLLVGFIELVKVFSVPHKHFFEEVHLNGDRQKINAFRDYLQKHDNTNRIKHILDVQSQLDLPLDLTTRASDSQKLNIFLSRSWIQAIAWHITFENGLLANTPALSMDCLAKEFPIKIARDFLATTKDLPAVAFEANGPGVCVKLLEIANSLVFALPSSCNNSLLADSLYSIFNLVNRFKNHISLPADVYNKVAGKLSTFFTQVERPLSLRSPTAATIEELFEDNEIGENCPSYRGSSQPLPEDKDAYFTQILKQSNGVYPHAMANALPGISHSEDEIAVLARNELLTESLPSFSNFMHPP